MRIEIRTLHLAFFIAFLTSSCMPGDSEVTGDSNPSPRSTPTPVVEKIDDELQKTLARLSEEIPGEVGVAAVTVETGDAAYIDRSGHYPMQSVYKVPIAMAVLKIVDSGRLRLDQEIAITPDDFVRQGFHSPIRNTNPQGTLMRLEELIRYSISESDGTASDVLLDLVSGPQAVQAYLSEI
ncbi:MAG: serine hydrolase, partial [Acidobacteriota bacterium]